MEEKKNGIDLVSIRLIKDYSLRTDYPVDTPDKAVKVLGEELAAYDKEVVCILNLNTKTNVINANICAVGTLNETLAHPREIFKSAILSNAHSIIVLHNHPSQAVTPSEEDRDLTRRIIAASHLIGIPLLDHLVVGSKDNYYSFRREENSLWENYNTPYNSPFDDFLTATSVFEQKVEYDSDFVEKYSQPQDLDMLVYNVDWVVRRAVAEQGRPQDLDILVHDEDEDVRLEVVKHGRPQDLDVLVHDDDVNVRIAVAKHGRPQNLDILVHDDDVNVRCYVAMQGRPQDLDILVYDKNEIVRSIVAERGRDKNLDILVDDEHQIVRRDVAKQGRPQDLAILVRDDDWQVRREVAKHGRPQDLAILVHDDNEWVRMEVARHGRPQDLDVLVHDDDVDVRDEATFKQSVNLKKNEDLKQVEAKRYNGFTKIEIEEDIKAQIEELINKYLLDINLVEVKVYGSRTRDNLYHYYSDLDIAVSYNGKLKEDSLFNILNDDLKYLDAPNGRLKLDINPINEEVSGTMEDFLKKSEIYLDEKEKKLLGKEKENLNIVCFDTETTGFNPYGGDEILQLSIIDGNFNTLFNEYFKPENKSEWKEAEAVNKISPEFVADKKPAKEYLAEIQKIFDNADVIVGYNTQFDLKFLDAIGIKIPEKAKIEDVMLDFAEIYGEFNEYFGNYKWQKLTKCAAYYDFDWDCTGIPAHNSLGDCHATLYCYDKINESKALENDQKILINIKKEDAQYKNIKISLPEDIHINEELSSKGFKQGYFYIQQEKTTNNKYNEKLLTIELPEKEEICIYDNNGNGHFVKVEELSRAIQEAYDNNYIKENKLNLTNAKEKEVDDLEI